MPKLHKQDFEIIATAIRTLPEALQSMRYPIAAHFAAILMHTNIAFKRSTFLQAAGALDANNQIIGDVVPTLKVIISGGVCQDVLGLPEGWEYEVVDHDDTDDDTDDDTQFAESDNDR